MEEHEHTSTFIRESDEWLSEHKDDSLSINTNSRRKKPMQHPVMRRHSLPRSAVIYSE